jgi:tetratricopeptide (TPR) repeat protein/O-antigen ligase
MKESNHRMSVIRIRDPQSLRPSHVVLLAIVLLTLAGGAIVLSAPESTALVDGAREWHEGSILRAVVQLVCLNYSFPTIYPDAVKMFVLGLGAGLGIIVLGLAVWIGSRAGDEVAPEAEIVVADGGDGSTAAGATKTHIAPLWAAQMLTGLFLVWSFASSRWSLASDLALMASVLLVIQYAWSFVLGYGLSPAAARIATRMLIGVAAVSAMLAVWYYYERNPTLRAKFPSGNPLFLAAALLPGILLAGAMLWERLVVARSAGGAARFGPAAVAAGVLAVCLWAFFLADSRASQLGLGVGLLAATFFALPRGRRWIPVAALPVLGVLAWYVFTQAGVAPDRGTTARFREYAWSYALKMFDEKRITGFGQGGFVLLGDSFVENDVLTDPLPFTSRVEHAHNEWLETLADLGSVGFVLIAAGLALTLRAGMLALARLPSRERWALIGLLSAMVAIAVEECFSPGLRVSGVPTMFFTVIGLIWAMAGSQTRPPLWRVSRHRGGRALFGAASLVLGVGLIVVNHRDFASSLEEYKAEEYLRSGELDQAIRSAERGAVARLNPQRALTSLAMLVQAHIRSAGILQERAMDREARAFESDPPDPNLLSAAAEDIRKSKEHCAKGSEGLKRLLERSPRFILSGMMEYSLLRIQAQNVARTDGGATIGEYQQNALKALERELLRRPYNMVVAAEYLNTVSAETPLIEQLTVMARPLRHNRMEDVYSAALQTMAATPQLREAIAPLVAQALEIVKLPQLPAPDTFEAWSPELLRIAASVAVLSGRLEDALPLMEPAALASRRLAGEAPMGASAAFEELAAIRFALSPLDPQGALDAIRIAIELAPGGEEGRRMQTICRDHTVGYLLAAGDEPEALAMLTELAGPGAEKVMLDGALGTRYVELCEMVLNRRYAARATSAPPGDLTELIAASHKWIQRARELAPDDYRVPFMAATMFLEDGDEEAAVARLREALALRIPPEPAVGFVATGLQRRPDSPVMLELWKEFRERIPSLPESPLAPAPQPPAEGGAPPEGQAPPAEPRPEEAPPADAVLPTGAAPVP